MRKTTPPAPATATEKLTIAFQKFNGVYLAKISNLKDKETFAYGGTKSDAEVNALANYRLKYANS